MGAALIVPVLALVVALAIWFFYGAGKTAKAHRDEAAPPDDPYQRREAELERLRADHEQARAENVTHPARRP